MAKSALEKRKKMFSLFTILHCLLACFNFFLPIWASIFGMRVPLGKTRLHTKFHCGSLYLDLRIGLLEIKQLAEDLSGPSPLVKI